MAEGGGNLESESLERVVTCQICFHFMEDARILLPCTHSFCTDCVMKLNRKRHRGKTTISCPMCREDILEENIHKNRTMAELMDIVKAKQKQSDTHEESGLMCAQCDSTNVEFKCTHCEVNLCLNCKPRHERFAKCRDKIFNFQEAERIQKKNPTIYCSRHPNEPIKMNCRSCDVAICSECKFTTHDMHQSESLESALERYRNTVSKALVGMKKKTKQTTTEIAQVKRKMEKVKENHTKVQDDIDETYEKIISKINTERKKLSSDLQIQCGAQLKELQLELESLENSLSCDNSIQTWTEAIMTNTDGGVLLTELQSGLLNKIKELQQKQGQTLEQYDSIYKMYNFKASMQVFSSSLGEIMISSTETDQLTAEIEVIINMADTLIRSCRHVNFDLNTLVQRQITSHCDINIDDRAIRMCVFKNKLYLPCYNRNTIKVFSLTGQIIQTTILQGIDRPRSLHPLDSDHLVLASVTGFHILDSNTLTITSQLATGAFDDVYVDGDTIAALRQYEKKVYLWDAKEMSQPKHSFSVSLGETHSTLCVYNNHIYVCDCQGNTIHQYNMQGHHIQQYGVKGTGGPGELNCPRLCLTDKQSNMLVADFYNNKLQVLSATGQWSVLKTRFKRPYDAVIVDNSLYILHEDPLNRYQPYHITKISVYKL